MGLNNHRAAKVPWLSPANMKKRVAFAKANMNTDWTQVHPMLKKHFTPQVRFSDEKRFSFESDAPVSVWRYKGERYKAQLTTGVKKFSKRSSAKAS